MKLNDLTTKLDKQVDLLADKPEIIAGVSTTLKNKTLEDFSNGKNKLDIKKYIKLEVSKNKTRIFDSLTQKKLNNLDLPQIIKKQNNLLNKIKRFFITKSKQAKNLNLRNLDLKNLIFDYLFANFTFKKVLSAFFIFFIFISISTSLTAFFAKKAISDLKNIESSLEIESNLTKAKYNFLFANIAFLPFSIIPQTDLQNINHSLKAGFSSSKLALGLLELYKTTDIKNTDITEYLAQNRKNISRIGDTLNYIEKHISKIKLKKQNPYYNKLQELKSFSLDASNIFNAINNDFSSFLTLLGNEKTMKYLIAFQNNDEIRVTGGFVGSVGIVDIFRGKVKAFEKRDIYALEWEINKYYTNKIKPPEPINNLTSSFGLRDANNYIDFSESAKTMNYFLKIGNYDFDGIVFINMSSIEDILAEIGYIDFEKINTIITNKNFAEIISGLVEAKNYKVGSLGTPKQVLFDFAQVLQEKILKDKKNILKTVSILTNDIKTRDIVFTAFNPKLDNLVVNIFPYRDIDYKETLDFAYPSFVSIGGNKTDRYINRTYSKQIKKLANCDIKTNLEIELNHTFSPTDKQRLVDIFEKYNIEANPDLLNIQGAGTNRTFTKLLLPKDAIIKQDDSIKIEKTPDFTIVSYYSYINPGAKNIKNIEYLLKNKSCRDYDFKLYKQSGVRKYNLNLKNGSSNKLYSDIKSDFYIKLEKN